MISTPSLHRSFAVSLWAADRIPAHRRAASQPDRQRADSLPGQLEERIADRRSDRRRARLADSAEVFEAGVHDVHLDAWRGCKANHVVAREVRLLDASRLHRDLAMQRGGQAEDDRALHLSDDDVGVDGEATVDRTHDTAH